MKQITKIMSVLMAFMMILGMNIDKYGTDVTLDIRQNGGKIVLLGDSIVHGSGSTDHNSDGDVIIAEEDIILPFPDGTWSSESLYALNAYVKYEGNYYKCQSAVSTEKAAAPDEDSAHWQVIPDWNSGSTYAVNDSVKYASKLYECKSAVVTATDVAPDTDQTHWQWKMLGDKRNIDYYGDKHRSTGVCSWGALFKNYVEMNYRFMLNDGGQLVPAEKPRISVVNNGIPSWDLHGITVNIDNLIPTGTKMVIVCAGINDRNSDATTIKQYYRELFDALNEKGVTTIALSPTDTYYDIYSQRYGISMARINTALETVCREKNVTYVNLFSELNAAITMSANDRSDYYSIVGYGKNKGQVDNVHPSDLGHRMIFGIVCKALNF